MVFLFKMASKHSAEMLSGVPKCKKAVMCHMEKMPLLEKASLRQGFELLTMTSMLINQQDILNKVFFNRKAHKTRSCSSCLMKML